jgi:hypothetical protein
MTTVNTHTDGRVRKSLADQIDRLDRILDGLADGLNEAVATAVKEAVSAAVQESVRAVLSELLVNPDLLRTIRDGLAPPTTAEVPVVKSTASQAAGTACPVVGRRWACLRARVLGGMQCLAAWLGSGRRRLDAAWTGLCAGGQFLARHWRPVLIAVGIGSAAGVAAYLLGPWLCTAAGGLAGFTASLAVEARRAVRRLAAAASMPRA